MRRSDWFFLLAMIATVAGVAGSLWYGETRRGALAEGANSASEGPAIGGPFTLVDQNGTEVTERDLLGHFSIVYFGYTYCPDVCPLGLSRITQALERLGPQADKVVPIFITVDPARDTVADMKVYSEHFHPRLRYLTGSDEQVKQALSAYKVYRNLHKQSPDDTEYLVDHTAITYVMGPDGKYAAHFSHGTSVDVMVQRLKRLLYCSARGGIVRRLSLVIGGVVFLALIVALGLWVGEFAGERMARVAPPPAAPTAMPAPAPLFPAPVLARTFANILPYAPATPLDEPGPFRLIDQERRIIDNRDLRGHFSLVFFGYTNCGNFCVRTLDLLSLVLAELGTAADAVTVYFITVDPGRDTRAELASWVSGLHERVRALTGTEEQIEQALMAFGVQRVVHAPANAQTADYAVEHPGVVLLLDRQGRFRRTFAEGVSPFEIAHYLRANW